ncbi:MAG: hypothetical protein ABWX94_02890 [Candidatus Saccharimonadales bacterium]
MNTAPFLEVSPLPAVELDPNIRDTLVLIPLSTMVEADLSAPQIADPDVQPVISGAIPCEFPACQAGGKTCTAVCK